MTPVFKSAIDEITFNPAWVVPPTIYLKDILPKVRGNRAYLAANRLHVFDAQWREVSPQSVDWNSWCSDHEICPGSGAAVRAEATDSTNVHPAAGRGASTSPATR